MSGFTPKEIEYLRGQQLGRLATDNAIVFAAGGRQVNADFDSELIRITPTRIVAWGIDTNAYRPNSRSVDTSERPSAS